MRVWMQNGGKGCDVDPNEIVFIFGDSYICANFVFWWKSIKKYDRKSTHGLGGYTDTLTDWQTQTDFIICPIYSVSQKSSPP